MPYIRQLQISLTVCVLLISVFGCGQHLSQNIGMLRTSDSHQGPKPTTAGERMQEAIATDDVPTVIRILDHEMKVDEILPNGRTALIDATIQIKIRIMVEVIKRGANFEIKSLEGKRALDYAMENAGTDQNGKPIMTRAILLLDKAAQLSQQSELMKFSGRGSAEPLMRLLRDVGVNPNFVDASGETPLTLAIKRNKLAAVSVLARWTDCQVQTSASDCLKLTATDVNLAGAEGKSPLMLAQELALTEIRQILLDVGAHE